MSEIEPTDLTGQRCQCLARPALECHGAWEPGCDLGNSEAHVKVHEQTQPERAVTLNGAGMVQDASRPLSNWFAAKPDAMRHAREAAAAIAAERSSETGTQAAAPPAAWPIKGVRVEDDKVIVSVKGGNDAARWLCGELIATMNAQQAEPAGHWESTCKRWGWDADGAEAQPAAAPARHFIQIGDTTTPANRLATVIANGLGSDHPAMNDLVELVFAAAPQPAQQAEPTQGEPVALLRSIERGCSDPRACTYHRSCMGRCHLPLSNASTAANLRRTDAAAQPAQQAAWSKPINPVWQCGPQASGYAIAPQVREPLTPDELADKCEAWLQAGGASNVVDAFEAGYRDCERGIGSGA